MFIYRHILTIYKTFIMKEWAWPILQKNRIKKLYSQNMTIHICTI